MEKFLQEVHAEQYTGIDDDMSDDYVNWCVNLDFEEWIELSDRYFNSKNN